MHTTTLRFGRDAWAALEHVAAESEVSVAEWVRQTTLARLAYVAGQRGEPLPGGLGVPASVHERVQSAAGIVADQAQAGNALWAQGRLARQRAQQLRDDTRRRRFPEADGGAVDDPRRELIDREGLVPSGGLDGDPSGATGPGR
jgi:hypothetical protein